MLAVLFFLNIIKFIKVPMLARILRVFLAGSWIFSGIYCSGITEQIVCNPNISLGVALRSV